MRCASGYFLSDQNVSRTSTQQIVYGDTFSIFLTNDIKMSLLKSSCIESILFGSSSSVKLPLSERTKMKIFQMALKTFI